MHIRRELEANLTHTFGYCYQFSQLGGNGHALERTHVGAANIAQRKPLEQMTYRHQPQPE